MSDMGRELESIGQVTNVGDLPEKLAEVEEAKVQVEGQLLERVRSNSNATNSFHHFFRYECAGIRNFEYFVTN